MANKTKHGLGRGLGALLGGGDEAAFASATAPEGEAGERVQLIPLTLIDPDRTQPRRTFDPEALEELAQSIRSVGVIQPALVREQNGRYQLIAGERRFRAARMAGLAEIPAIVRTMDEPTRLEVSLIENLQRDDLNPIEEAEGVKRLMEQCGYTQEVAAKRLGKSRPAIANLLRLLTLDESVIKLVRGGKLSAGHARALAGLNDPALQKKLAELAVSQGWTVRQLEKICQQTLKGADEKPRAKAQLPAEAKELEKMARDAFGTKAELDGDMSRGKLTLHYYSADDLQRIWDVLEVIRQNT